MKKLNLLLAVLLSIGLMAGCGTEELLNNGSEPSKEDVVTKETPETTAEQTEVQSQESTKEEATKKEKEKTVSSTDSKKNTFDAEVVKVTDGDTIKVRIGNRDESVRFLLVDTPETSHPRLGEQPFGQEAKDFMKNLLEGKTVQLEKDVSDRDKYERLLYYVYVDGKSVQEELLKNGLARVAYVYAPNTKYVDKYYEIQKEAQAKAVGIWSVENYAQEDGYHKEIVEEEMAKKIVSTGNSNATSGDCNIKGNISSSGDKIYHMPDQQYYDVTKIDTSKGEKFFCSPQEAEAEGFRGSQR